MSISPTEPHPWQPLDVESGLEARQLTGPNQPNRWEVRNLVGNTVVLDDLAFDRLRARELIPEELR